VLLKVTRNVNDSLWSTAGAARGAVIDNAEIATFACARMLMANALLARDQRASRDLLDARDRRRDRDYLACCASTYRHQEVDVPAPLMVFDADAFVESPKRRRSSMLP